MQDLADCAVGEEQHVQRSWGGASRTGLRKGKGGELGNSSALCTGWGSGPLQRGLPGKMWCSPGVCLRTRGLINMPTPTHF